MRAVERRSANGADGYVEDIPYTYGYHPELDPAYMQAALRRAGVEPPQIETACELGYGQGISLAIHAVAGRAAWWGTDLLPAHAAHVRSLVAGTAARSVVAEQPFDVFCARLDLPQFDFIGLHGVWSWVSAANRRCIVGLAARSLRPGGVLYLSYNALPGWAPMLPLREMMVAYAAALPPDLPRAARIEAALRDAQMRVLRDPVLAEAHPDIDAELRAIRHKDVAYLAHEFFNRDWAPMRPADVAATLGSAGLSFAAQADGAAPGPDTRFRREYWVKDGVSSTVAMRVRDSGAMTSARRHDAQTLNDRLLALSLRSPGPAWLADPSTGGGVEVGYTAMLMLAAWRGGVADASALARDAEATLARLGQRLVHEGRVLTEDAQIRARLESEARDMLEVTLPRLRERGVLA
jgi:SAM-dependent methyltransferase